MKTVSLVGARPQFVKLAPVNRAMVASSSSGGTQFEDIIVHTGQHYDPGLSDIFFSELEIPKPDVELGVGSGSHGEQTARMLQGVERVLLDTSPDMLIIYGDTNSTVAGALAAAKLHVPIAHIEAGLRSFDRRMPEEVNRIVSDHVSDLLLAPTETAMKNLAAENLAARSYLVGDVMLDAVTFNLALARKSSDVLSRNAIQGAPYGIVTMHRPSNTDTDRLRELLDTLNDIATRFVPLVFPLHPRTAARIESDQSDWSPAPKLRLIEPVGYLDMLRLLDEAALVLTDSGGLQKEAFFLNVPCVTLRDETEWIETVDGGGNVIAGTEPDRILAAAEKMLGRAELGELFDAQRYFGDGSAATAIVEQIAA